MSFDPYKVKQHDMEDWDDPRGEFVRAEDFNQMLDYWEDSKVEVARLEKIIKNITELCEEL